MSPAGGYEGIVVLGVPRSGTTLVRRLLNAHPRIACPPETNLLSAAARFLAEQRFAGGLSVGVIPGLDFAGFSEAEVLERFREFLFSFWREIARRAGKARWAEKTAVDVFHLDAI
jgi:protein-tyrosine sulfotransferase